MTSNRAIHDIQTLEKRFPIMFRGPVISMAYYRGWFPDFVDLCFELDAVLGDYKPCFQWLQIKEKLGGYRMHFSMLPQGYNEDVDNGEVVLPDHFVRVRQEARRMVGLASLRMNDKCCVCGEFAVVAHHGTTLVTLCNFHLPAARAARGDTRSHRELAAVPASPQELKVWRPSS